MQRITEAVLAGANDDAVSMIEVVSVLALNATAKDVTAADGYLIGTPANFGYMSGAIKHFLDSTFLDIGGSLSADGSASMSSGGRKPFGLYVHGRYDTTGAARSVLSIVSALPWRQCAPVLEILGEVTDTAGAYELGATAAANLMS